MKYFFTLIFILSFSNCIQAQCTDLFFSEYIEGWSNNKALEIYNPTTNAIDLSAYSISRYSNGGTSPSTSQLSGTIEPFSTFVVGLDKRNPDGEGYEAPMWDGYYTYVDSITNEEVTTYNADTDLQSKIDLFLNPIYYFGTDPDSAAAFPTTLYFNGNDAITLELLGGGVIDLIGKVGEDPGASWVDNDGNYWTKDHTLIRKPSIQSGIIGNPIIFDPTLEWDSLPVNTFTNLGSHNCVCQNNNNLFENEQSFVIYPNPSNNEKVTISSLYSISSITIHNQIGQEVSSINIPNLNKAEVTLPNKKDIYFVSVKHSFGIKTQPIILH